MTSAIYLKGLYIGNINFGAKAVHFENFKCLEDLCRLSDDDLITLGSYKAGRKIEISYKEFKKIIDKNKIGSLHLSEEAYGRHCKNPLPFYKNRVF